MEADQGESESGESQKSRRDAGARKSGPRPAWKRCGVNTTCSSGGFFRAGF
jgi:hypothetical protein